MPNGAKRWCFTINNYHHADEDQVQSFGSKPECTYLVYGREVGENGTPHLQGYFILNERKSLAFCKRCFHGTAHLEVSRGTPEQASEYCKKDGDVYEQGELPVRANGGGKRTDLDAFIEWLDELDYRPSRKECLLQHPRVACKYRNFFELACAKLPERPRIDVESVELRDWQRDLATRLDGRADDRTVEFFIDNEGNTGKTFFCTYLLSKFPDDVQILKPAKRDDMAHAVDETRRIFVIDCPRGTMEYLRYDVLEMLKDGIVFSPKYNSSTKIFPHNTHVIVFSNEAPLMDKLSRDRYKLEWLTVHNGDPNIIT